MEHEQAGAEVSDALRAAKYWALYRQTLQRAEAAEAEKGELAALLAELQEEARFQCAKTASAQAEALGLRAAVGYEKGRADAAERALAIERARGVA